MVSAFYAIYEINEFYAIYETYAIYAVYEINEINEFYAIYEINEFYAIYEINEIYAIYEINEINEIYAIYEINEIYAINEFYEFNALQLRAVVVGVRKRVGVGGRGEDGSGAQRSASPYLGWRGLFFDILDLSVVGGPWSVVGRAAGWASRGASCAFTCRVLRGAERSKVQRPKSTPGGGVGWVTPRVGPRQMANGKWQIAGVGDGMRQDEQDQILEHSL